MKIVITANGKGERMKCLSPLPKHELYFGDKKIIDQLLEIFPDAEVLTCFPSESRRETLERIKDYEDCLIIDCDIVIDPLKINVLPIYEDWIFAFNSTKDKYSSIRLATQGSEMYVHRSSEYSRISDVKCSGVYFVKSVGRLLERMEDDNSIISGMSGAKVIMENYITKVGDPDDYYEALGIHNDSFTGNRVEINKRNVIKYCKTGREEAKWYLHSYEFDYPALFFRPSCFYHDEEMIITERIFPTSKPTAEDFIRLLFKFATCKGNDIPFITYLDNLPAYDKPLKLPEHPSTFFHGDLSTHNVLKNSRLWLIDPNHKGIFGSWLTDAGKAVFSFIAYEKDYLSAKKIADAFSDYPVWNFAVAEGLRVTKYKPEYMSIVNNIYEIARMFTIDKTQALK